MRILSGILEDYKDLAKRIKRNPAKLALIVWFSFMWSWSFITDSLELAGSKRQGFIIALLVVVVNVSISTLVVVKMLKLIRSVHSRAGNWIVLLGLPLFAFMDFLVSWLITIIWIGPEGSIDNILPMGSLALPTVTTPLRFAARFVGFYGLAAFTWLILYLVFQKKNRRLALAPLGIAAVLSLAGWLIYRTPNGVLVEAKLVSETLTNRVPAIEPKGYDLVVFPEYGLEKITNKNLNKRITPTKDDQPKTYFVGSEQIYSMGITGHRNNMMFGNTKDGITQREDKYRLIPGGEDLSYIVRILLRATGQRSTLDYFSYAKGVIKGDHQLEPFDISDKVRVAAAVCSSIIAPHDYRDFAASGATLFTNSASLSTFKGSRLFAWQQKNLARFMATANSRFFLQSANASSAYVLDNNGKQLGEVRGIQTLDAKAITNSTKTPYTFLGEWVAWLGAFVIAEAGLQALRRKQLTRVKHKCKLKTK